MKGKRGLLLSLASMVFFSGCGRVADYARVVEANRLHERGDYQGAILAYAGADHSSFPATIDYDLANVYARLGEYAAAADLYAAARRESDSEGAAASLVADAYFNEGVALFERGRYKESWKAFRAALSRAKGDRAFSLDARRNLELAWRAWQKSSLALPKGIAASSRGASDRDDAELRLLQRLETGRWRPGAVFPPSDLLDY
jgi:tetratricopeptide (TPR) repeat protein